MATQKSPGERRPDATESPDQRPRRGWERAVVKPKDLHQARSTFRSDAPSPSQEILAKHEASLAEQAQRDERSAQIVCF